jgi:hypothetical protein
MPESIIEFGLCGRLANRPFQGMFKTSKREQKMEKHIILGVHITSRAKHVPMVQTLFTEYGCSIKTRLGLHEVNGQFCSPNGLVVLEMCGDEKTCNQLADKLGKVEGVEVQKMVFSHP